MILLSLGCGKKTTGGDEQQTPQLYFSPVNASVVVGQDTSISLMVKDISPAIFGISMEISFDSTIVSFSDSLGFEVGTMFGTDAIQFVRQENSIIHLSITEIQGQNSVSGSGTIGTLKFGGHSVGSSEILVVPDKLHFYDSNGREITISECEIGDATVQCISSN
jgi:hypothetical protein